MATVKPLILYTDVYDIETLRAGDALESTIEGVSAVNNTGGSLTLGTAVNLFNNSGTLEMQKASAESGVGQYECSGILTETVTDTNSGVVKTDGIVSGLTSLTIAGKYYLSATAGAIVTTPPTSTGQLFQELGLAISATQLALQIKMPIKQN